MDTTLQKQLISWANVDRKAHDTLWTFGDKETRSATRWMAIDEIFQKRLWDIVEKHGLPGIKLVGQEGAIAFWELLQQTPDTKLQRTCLKLMEESVKKGDFPEVPLKYLTDRVCLLDGKEQKYGTLEQNRRKVTVSEPILNKPGLKNAASQLPARSAHPQSFGKALEA